MTKYKADKKTTDSSEILKAQQDSRAQNIQWTMANNYKWIPDKLRYNNLNFENEYELDTYGNMIEGAIHSTYRYEIISAFKDYLKSHHKEADSFISLLYITLETGAYEKNKQERPALTFYRKKRAKEVTGYFSFVAPHNESELLELAHAERILGYVPKISPMMKVVLNSLEGLDNENTEELIKDFYVLLKEHFHFDPTLKDDEKLNEVIEKIKKKDAVYLISDEKALQEQMSITSAEFTENMYLDDRKRENAGDVPSFSERKPTKQDKEIREFLEKNYGDSILTSKQEALLLNQVATGLHEDMKLLVTEGTWKDESNSYRKTLMKESYDEKCEYLDDNYVKIHREIMRLSDKLKGTILNDLDSVPALSHGGKLVAPLVWRSLKVDDGRVFQSTSNDDPGSLIVDLVLDSSASQIDRQTLVAMQGFILASALKNVKIPFRVTSFQSQQGYTIIKQMMDYNSLSDPKNILRYFPDAANRDGFALRTVRARMETKQRHKNVIIVLSDGKPNDERNGINTKRFLTKNQYTGDLAIDDTAHEVRNLRQEGIPVLGVFTGEENDLPAAQRIYGTNLAYIKKLERFSEIVSSFLEDELRYR